MVISGIAQKCGHFMTLNFLCLAQFGAKYLFMPVNGRNQLVLCKWLGAVKCDECRYFENERGIRAMGCWRRSVIK